MLGRHLYLILTICASATRAQYQIVQRVGCFFWSHWSPPSAVSTCQADCGPGQQTRTRTRACLNPGRDPPPGCRFFELEKELSSCDSGLVCNGVVGTWGTWTSAACSQFCGWGFQLFTRTRVCTPGLCGVALSETRTDGCVGQGGYCRIPCRPPRTFIYMLGTPVSHVCLRGVYVQVQCPTQPRGLVSTCSRDYVKCQVYTYIERNCFRQQLNFRFWG